MYGLSHSKEHQQIHLDNVHEKKMNIISAVEEFFEEALGIIDYEIALRGLSAVSNELDNESSSLLENTKDGVLKRSLPAIMHPFRLENYGISISFFNTGVSLFLLITPVTYYLIDTLGADSSQVNAFITLVALPWSMKLLFGLITDSVSVLGYRRKSWMVIGWVFYCTLITFVSFFERPSLVFITTTLFFSTCSYLFADVCNDAQSVERSKFEPIELRGSYQTAMYTIRGFGMIVGAIQATFLYNTASFGWGLTLQQLFWLALLIPLTTCIPFSYFVVELNHHNHHLPSIIQSLEKVWEVLQLKAVWYPLIFYLPYNCLQLSNSAWSNYLVLSLEFSDFHLGLITISGSFAYFLGVLFFQRVAFEQNWRHIMVFNGIGYTCCTLLQIILFTQENLSMGISNLTYACLVVGLQYFFVGVNSMPFSMICVMVCPENSEGVMYALLTTIANLAGTVALDFSTVLSYAFSVSNSDLSIGVTSGMISFTITVCIIQLLPLILVGFSPATRLEQQALIDSHDSSFVGGITLVAYIVLCLIFTLALNFSLLS